MKLLVLGGTVFLGRHIVDAALARNHEVTLFNRGQHNAHLYPDLEKLCGDRDGGLDALKDRIWDAVVDTCGHVPRLVSDSACLLADAVDHYTFISSISVYNDFSATRIRENTAVGTLEDETVEEVTDATYGPLKALCEQAAEVAMPGRVLSVRAGLIVGAHDPSDRFTYWPVRVARGGEVLAPSSPEAPVQFIDVRDLAQWIMHMAEQKKTGVYNATGPAELLTFGQFLDACRETTGSDATFTWPSAAFLAGQEMPSLWVPGEKSGMFQADIAKATADGLTFRPLSETVYDTLTWAHSRPGDNEWRAGLSPQREAEVLAAWHQAFTDLRIGGGAHH
jgi:2'-hydroxyisoflavone reductase